MSSENSTPKDKPTLKTTPLHALHTELGGRLVDFAGWELPIQYEGVVAEHNWCRTSAALFDVSHMGVVELHGENVAASLEQLTPAGLTTLKPGKIRYALFTNDEGGVIDDLMVSNVGDHLMIVVNAARREVDLPHLRANLPSEGPDKVEIIERADVALLALQGPKAVETFARLAPAVSDMAFMEALPVEVILDGPRSSRSPRRISVWIYRRRRSRDCRARQSSRVVGSMVAGSRRGEACRPWAPATPFDSKPASVSIRQ